MALITGLGLIVVSILTAVLSRILAEEMSAWIPSITRLLINFAVGRLPESKRERFVEEWQSHVNEVPGQVGKVLVAFGFLFAAYHVALNDRRNQYRELRAHFLTQVDEALFTSTTLMNLMSNEEFASLERVALGNEVRSLLNEAKEIRNELATLYAIPDTPLTSIVRLSQPLKARRLIASTDRVKRVNARMMNLLEKVKRSQVR